MNHYKVKVKFEATGLIEVFAENEQKLWDKVVKMEGFDPNAIDDVKVIDVEPLESSIIEVK